MATIVGDLLAGVPCPFENIRDHPGRELDLDLFFGRAPVHAKAASGDLVKVEGLWNDIFFLKYRGLVYPGQAEGTDRIAQMTVADDIPVAIIADGVIGIQFPAGRALSGRLVVDLQSVQRPQAFEHGLPYIVADRRAGGGGRR